VNIAAKEMDLAGQRVGRTCPTVERPGTDDYDTWQAWAIDLFGQYDTCAARHAKTVQAWPG
jgi:hypothetical protein